MGHVQLRLIGTSLVIETNKLLTSPNNTIKDMPTITTVLSDTHTQRRVAATPFLVWAELSLGGRPPSFLTPNSVAVFMSITWSISWSILKKYMAC